MGIGDEIMASGHAYKKYKETGKPVAILDRHGNARSHFMWEGLPFIASPAMFKNARKKVETIVNGPRCRPYIDHTHSVPSVQWVWQSQGSCEDYRGHIVLDKAERELAKEYKGLLIVEPNVKLGDGTNKAWGRARMMRVIERTPHLPWAQLGPDGTIWIGSARHIITDSFRLAAAIMSSAIGYVGMEGAMHHTAAAFHKPAIVIFGGFIHPSITGYTDHVNLFTGGTACGNRLTCGHCRRAMDAISVSQVTEEVKRLFG